VTFPAMKRKKGRGGDVADFFPFRLILRFPNSKGKKGGGGGEMGQLLVCWIFFRGGGKRSRDATIANSVMFRKREEGGGWESALQPDHLFS